MKILFYYFMGGGGGLANINLLLRAMARSHPDDTFEIVTSPATAFDSLWDMPNIHIQRFQKTGIKELDRLLLNIFYLPRMLCKAKADLLWSMNVGPYVKMEVPSVLSIHNPHQVYDWAVARYHPGTRLRVALLRSFFQRSLRLSDGVIAQTCIMAEHIRRVNGAPERVCVIPKAVEKDIDVHPEPLPATLQDSLAGRLGRGAFTFLYASSFIPHKNHAVLVRICKVLRDENIKARVIATVTAEELRACGGRETEELIDQGYLVAARWVAKSHLRALYEAADACLMPSVLESLSSSYIEAMQWGRPQIVSDLAFARDICGNAALYANTDDENAWVRQIKRIMTDSDLRRNLTNAGTECMKLFPTSWEQAAESAYRFMMSIRQNTKGREGKT